MSRSLLAMALVALVLASPLFAQDMFYCGWAYIYDFGGGQPLTTTCPGPTPIEDGRVVKIFWDSNSNGPDPSDPQPTLCNDPPTCNDAPPGTVNIDHFEFNGQEEGYGLGYFLPLSLFNSYGLSPQPPRYYLRVYESDGTTILWTSAVETLTAGYQEIYLTFPEWTCGSSPTCVVHDEQE